MKVLFDCFATYDWQSDKNQWAIINIANANHIHGTALKDAVKGILSIRATRMPKTMYYQRGEDIPQTLPA